MSDSSTPALPLIGEQYDHGKRTISDRLRLAGSTIAHHARKHVGVGIVCAVAYFDP